jgi:DNA mismatch repair protein MutL
MPKIRVLSPQLACQIAAGEVIERPASVVKELVENSLDAGASQIDITLEGGGIGLIRVRDDGYGISREDLPLALARHATSKIATFEDLRRIRSFGFRGEALPSIAAVARLELVSKTLEEPCGWRIQAGPEGVSDPAPASHPPGTTVTVADLFYSVPARRKFLRREEVEFGHIRSLIERFALGCFKVGFVLRHNGRPVWNLPPARTVKERQARLAQVLGQEFLSQAVEVECAGEGLRLSGWIGSKARITDKQLWYVNGRPVSDRLLKSTLRLSLRGALPNGQQPQAVLYLELDPEAVDVNAHPAKLEVRFRDPRRVSDFIVSSLSRALGRKTPRASYDFGWRREGDPPKVSEAAEGYQSLRQEARPAIVSSASFLGEALACLSGLYILAEAEQGLVIVDLQAARERLPALACRSAGANGTLSREEMNALLRELEQAEQGRLSQRPPPWVVLDHKTLASLFQRR